jgi:hypothetical protein
MISNRSVEVFTLPAYDEEVPSIAKRLFATKRQISIDAKRVRQVVFMIQEYVLFPHGARSVACKTECRQTTKSPVPSIALFLVHGKYPIPLSFSVILRLHW